MTLPVTRRRWAQRTSLSHRGKEGDYEHDERACARHRAIVTHATACAAAIASERRRRHFIKNTDPAEFEFSDEDLAPLRGRMLARAKRPH